MNVQSAVTSDLMRQSEILGTAVGVDAAGTPVLTVYVDRDAANAGEVVRDLPRQFGGVGVQIHLTDKFRATARPPEAERATRPNKPRLSNWEHLEVGPTILPTVSAVAGRLVHLSKLAAYNIS